MIEVATSENDDEGAGRKAPARPIDPRRAPDVVAALARAGRRDPHPDPFKALGRACLLIWVAMLVSIVILGGPAQRAPAIHAVQKEAISIVHKLAGSAQERKAAIRKIERGGHATEVAAVTGFASGTFVFACYYALIYLGFMNMRRLVADAGQAIKDGTARIKRWRARRKARLEPAPDMVIERTPAGPAPHIQ